jgi:hypothetical protein
MSGYIYSLDKKQSNEGVRELLITFTLDNIKKNQF